MSKSSISNRFTGRCRRTMLALQRLWQIGRFPGDFYLIPLLYAHLCKVTLSVRYGEDSLRRVLQSKQFLRLPDTLFHKEETRLLLLIERLIAWVPYGRKHRCLIVSLVAFHYMTNSSYHRVVFKMATLDQDDRSGGLHCWLEYGDAMRLDLDPTAKRQLVYEYPAPAPGNSCLPNRDPLYNVHGQHGY